MFEKSRDLLVSGARRYYMERSKHFEGTVFDNCSHVVLYPQVKCAFNRVKKAANSSTLLFMSDALEANGLIDPRRAEDSNYIRSKYESINLGKTLSEVCSPLLLKQVSTYYWFTVVRNPYTRLLSAFLQKGAAGQRGKPHFKNIPGFDRLDPSGFREFVWYLKNGGLYDDRHWWPQSDLLFMPIERFDYIAKTESLGKDLEYVFQQIGLSNAQHLSFSKPHDVEQSAGWKVTNANSREMEYYDKELRGIVNKLYMVDFIKLGYDPVSQ